MGMFLNRGNEEFIDVVNSEIYVDKTDMIEFLNKAINTEQRYVAVSRPRRFGKSITANMIAAYFEKGCDSRFLFEGRKLGEIAEWDRNLNRYDVIRIDLAEIMSESDTAESMLEFIEKGIIKELISAFPDIGVDIQDKVAAALDKINAKTGNRFVIIIDEWDCLFRDDKKNVKAQERYVNLLRVLFKGNRAKKFLALGYITGILPIKKYNSESALNNFYEYSMLNPGPLTKYIGFSADEVKSLCEKYETDYKKAMEWYDGYNFENEEHIYGPNSVVQSILMGKFENYWSKTAAFSSLTTHITMNFEGLKDDIKMMLGGGRVGVKTGSFQNDMTSFKSKHDVLTVLIHLGYLAYDSGKKEAYIPNKEVREIFEYSIEEAGWCELIDAIEASEKLLDATINGDADEVAQKVEQCHKDNTSILKYNDENSLASCIALAYYTARKDYMIVRELPAGRGFADFAFIPRPNVDKPAMVIELKWDKTAETAISQIKERRYDGKLKSFAGKVLLVGINYEKGTKGEKSGKHTCIIEEK